jgi:hypothetical protein
MNKDIYKAVLAGFVALLVVVIGFFIGISYCMTADADSTVGFEVIDGGTWDLFWILYDRETGVMYTMSNGTKNSGTMTLMVNPDGTPRVYEGFSGK